MTDAYGLPLAIGDVVKICKSPKSGVIVALDGDFVLVQADKHSQAPHYHYWLCHCSEVAYIPF